VRSARPRTGIPEVRGRLVWLLLACLTRCPAVAAKTVPSTVQDLQYGEVLFHYYQQDYFASIVCLLTARAQSRLPHHAEEAELLLGGLDLSYGLRDEAERIFTRLLNADTTREEARNRAWYYLARVSWQRGEPDRALRALDRLQGKLPAAISEEAGNLQGLILLASGQNDKATTLLRRALSRNGGSPYLRYNLGVALIRSGSAADGEAQLDAVGQREADDEESRLLRDKANLALGYGYLQNGAAGTSRRVLERVRLEGPLSNKALLGAGWADAEAGDYARALVPWTELGRREPTDPAVQESLLAIPYALNRMNLHGRAAERYETAITLFQRERDRLDKAITAIGRGELLAALDRQTHDPQAQVLPFADGTHSPMLHYLPELLSSNEFQTALRNYRDLRALEDNLDTWARSITAYDDMLAARKARYALHAPDAAKALHSETLESLARRQAALEERVRAIEASDDPLGLASPEEVKQATRLAEIGARIDRLPRNDEIDGLRERTRRLQGILYWRANADYKGRLWQAKRQLAELDTLLAGARQSRTDLQQTGVGMDANLKGFDARIASSRAAIARLQSRTARTRGTQGGELERLAIDGLEQRMERLDAYLVQARFALAQTYDSALSSARPPGGGGNP
jgi:hypothetical protein